MPGKLRYFRSDPNKKGRGPGFYYHRGNGIFSKYSFRRDMKLRAHKVKGANWKYMHTADGTYVSPTKKEPNYPQNRKLWLTANRNRRI